MAERETILGGCNAAYGIQKELFSNAYATRADSVKRMCVCMLEAQDAKDCRPGASSKGMACGKTCRRMKKREQGMNGGEIKKQVCKGRQGGQ